MELYRTPLYPLYAASGAKTVEFGGWDMPVQFTGILQEHRAVRERAGLFDVSHMGEFDVTGPGATDFLQHLVTNDVAKMEDGMAMYSPMTYDDGSTVDDLLLYRFGADHFWAVVNAGNIAKDLAWFLQHAVGYDVVIENKSADIALLAIQGPRALGILQPLTATDLAAVRYYRFTEGEVAGYSAILSRTGYTGEDGFELYLPAGSAQPVWQALLAAGRHDGLEPCGLGCRDTLRLEAKLPLYGHELTDHISPLEAGLGMFVKLDKGDFVGRGALAEQKTAGVLRKVVGIRVLERGIPRAGYAVSQNGKQVGTITSGTQSPTLQSPIALALLNVGASAVGTSLIVDIRGKQVAAEVVKTPFYSRPRR